MIALVAALGLMQQPNSDFRLNRTVDATTLHKKVLVWLSGLVPRGGDGGTEWDHWNRDWSTHPGRTRWTRITFDMWAGRERVHQQISVAVSAIRAGRRRIVQRAKDQQTVDKHFELDAGIGMTADSGAAVVTQTPPDNIQSWKTNVLLHVRAAANRTGRAFMIQYDMSGAKHEHASSAVDQ